MGLEKAVWLAKLQNVKCTVLLLFVLNGTVFGLALWLVSIQNSWPERVLVVMGILVVVSVLRVFWLGAMGFAQVAVASVMITAQQDKDAQAAAAAADDDDDDAATQDGSLTQRDRRRRYKQWVWGGRVGFLLACLQVVGAAYLTHVIVEKEYANIHHNGKTGHWQKTVLVILNVFSWAATVVQCCVGSNMMAWHSLYNVHKEAWRAHYREVFNHGIREALCCLGKSRYLSQLKNDEVDSVAALLGDLVAYRAQGASHLEVLAGVAMLKNQSPQLRSFSEKYKPAPAKELLEANILQPYAVAAYTGLLLDIGRNPLRFPCVWLYRQGVLAPWNRNQRPVLQGDNWWRGHAAAFLKHVNLPPEALRKGRVSQVNGEAVYFVVVLHKLRTVLVAIRGTETPEDLLTDGLSQECPLSNTDLLGLLTGPGIDEKVRSNVKDTMPHYAHIGIVNAARELSKELDNLTEDDNRSMTLNNSSAKSPDHECVEISESSNQGLLSKLLGSGGDCKGYKLRLVGHSLGGAIAALTGLRLRGRYPKLHVYAFGVLPCIDAVTAEACESFVTSVVYNDEFSSRLSVASMMRLRTNALNALASDSSSRNSSSRQHSKVMRNQVEDSSNRSSSSGSGIREEEDAMRRSSYGSTVSDSQDSTESGRLQFSHSENRINRKTRFMNRLKGGAFLCAHTCCCMLQMSHHHKVTSMASELDCEAQEHINKIAEDYSMLSWSQNEGMTRCKEHELMSTASFSHGGKATRVALNSASQVNGLGGAGQERYSSCVANGICTTGADSSSDESPRITENDPPRRMFSTNLCANGMPGHVGSDLVGYQLGSDLNRQYPAEMFIPGLVIHVIRDEKPKSESSWKLSFWYMWRQRSASETKYQAILTDRESFSNIVLSPAMFLDHMPWKCQHALNMVVKELKTPTELSRHDSTSSDNAV